jgi:hypothetical protein
MKAVAAGYSDDAKVGDWMTRHPETIEATTRRARGRAHDPRGLPPPARSSTGARWRGIVSIAISCASRSRIPSPTRGLEGREKSVVSRISAQQPVRNLSSVPPYSIVDDHPSFRGDGARDSRRQTGSR